MRISLVELDRKILKRGKKSYKIKTLHIGSYDAQESPKKKSI